MGRDRRVGRDKVRRRSGGSLRNARLGSSPGGRPHDRPARHESRDAKQGNGPAAMPLARHARRLRVAHSAVGGGRRVTLAAARNARPLPSPPPPPPRRTQQQDLPSQFLDDGGDVAVARRWARRARTPPSAHPVLGATPPHPTTGGVSWDPPSATAEPPSLVAQRGAWKNKITPKPRQRGPAGRHVKGGGGGGVNTGSYTLCTVQYPRVAEVGGCESQLRLPCARTSIKSAGVSANQKGFLHAPGGHSARCAAATSVQL